MSDFLVFLPEMIAEPVFLFHHGTLVLVSLVLLEPSSGHEAALH